MNRFDIGVLHYLNQIAGRSWYFDNFVVFICKNPLCGTAMIALLWWFWFRKSDTQVRDRSYILAGLAFSFISLIVARVLALLLPFRLRPANIPSLHLQLPYGDDPSVLINWSSFPSDHAVFYFALATTVFLVSRKIGLFCFLYAFSLICLPRIYLAIHYPTDILAGIVLGIGFGSLASAAPLREWIARRPLRWAEVSPSAFYTAFFVASFLFSTQFEPVRSALSDGLATVRHAKQLHQ